MLDQTSTKEIFNVCYFVQPLYVPAKGEGLGYGNELSDRRGHWSIDDPLLEERLATALLGEGMRKIGAVKAPADFLEYAKTLSDRREGPLSRCLTFALLHRFDEARDLGEIVKSDYGPQHRVRRQVGMLLRLFEGGPERVDRILRSWEGLTVRRLGIGKYWRSPWE
jgi:hypothetical protein